MLKPATCLPENPTLTIRRVPLLAASTRRIRSRPTAAAGARLRAGRVSMMDLNDKLATATGIAGGQQLVYTAGLNWYPTRNVRFMLNNLHGDISKQASPTSPVNTGSSFDAVAMRTQFAF